MNPNANDAPADAPAPPEGVTAGAANPPPAIPAASPKPAAPAAGRSTLKVAVPLVALVGVVFGITFLSQYTPKTDDDAKGPSALEPPLRFGSTIRRWEPPGTGSLQGEIFPGFFEAGSNLYPAAFWFENRNPNPVTMQLVGVSCTACSGGRVAPIPPAVARQLLEMTAVSALPQGLFNGLPTGLVGPAANLAPDRLEWQQFMFQDNPQATYKIPAAANADGWSPQWGILELLFRARVEGPMADLKAAFALQVDGTKQSGSAEFQVFYEPVAPFEVFPVGRIDAGILNENSEPRRYDIVVFSRTRGPDHTGPGEPGDLTPPRVAVQMPPGTPGEPGPFVSVGEPVRLPRTQLEDLSKELSARTRKLLRVDSAYRLVVTVAPKVGDARSDIGQLEREVWITVPGTETRYGVRIAAVVRGPVWLDNDRTDLEVPRYPARDGTSVPFRVVTERKDVELAVVGDQCRPTFLDARIKKLAPIGERGYHDLTLTVPKNSPAGPWSGVVVLELKGPHPQRIRIPVSGVGQ